MSWLLFPAQAAAVLKYIDELPVMRRYTTRTLVLSFCGVASYLYYIYIYCKPKYEYNMVHPYTSWIPITLWIVFRNMTPWLRVYSLRLYGWLGCVTLETYICQVCSSPWSVVHALTVREIHDGHVRICESLRRGGVLKEYRPRMNISSPEHSKA